MTWPNFDPDLIYDEAAGTVQVKGPMLTDYLDREVELMVIGVIQQTGGNITGAAFGQGVPGRGTLGIAPEDGTPNFKWQSTLKEDVEPQITSEGNVVTKTTTPKKLIVDAKKGTETFAIAFVKLKEDEHGQAVSDEWYGWVGTGVKLVPLAPASV